MDSTPTPVPVSTPITDHLNPPSHHPVSKLPVKRKNQISLPDSFSRRDSPSKFHRVWTEPDEILFLQSLVNSPPLSFPRDLHVFFTSFLNNISRTYSKSQLSEKLRRLRKKWRVVSTRLSKGLHLNRLSPHDKMLFELSEMLWHPNYAKTSPFGASLPSITAPMITMTVTSDVNVIEDDKCGGVECDKDENCCVDDAKLEEKLSNGGNEIGRIVAKTVVDVFDESVKFVKSGKRFCYGGGGGEGQCESFDKRWRELRVVEMEVLAQRLRLAVEDSIMKR
ncbi:uncharacterized protein LOC141719968 [Apium graveolens]|uniref:uncharacterized protein LOC141719968 n=1 Tax=Apium graveolens TaxID=4045 RepID=UPI003D799137